MDAGVGRAGRQKKPQILSLSTELQEDIVVRRLVDFVDPPADASLQLVSYCTYDQTV
jgi:hypothetical protein